MRPGCFGKTQYSLCARRGHLGFVLCSPALRTQLDGSLDVGKFNTWRKHHCEWKPETPFDQQSNLSQSNNAGVKDPESHPIRWRSLWMFGELVYRWNWKGTSHICEHHSRYTESYMLTKRAFFVYLCICIVASRADCFSFVLPALKLSPLRGISCTGFWSVPVLLSVFPSFWDWRAVWDHGLNVSCFTGHRSYMKSYTRANRAARLQNFHLDAPFTKV